MVRLSILSHSRRIYLTYQSYLVRVRHGLVQHTLERVGKMQSKGQEMTPIAVGIIGGGYGVSTLLPAIASINDFKVISLARSEKSSPIFGPIDLENKQIESVSASEIIENPHVNLVIVACPPSAQEKFAIAALENGKNVFCEKPGGLNAEATKRISKAIDASRGIATIGYQFRYDPLIVWLQKKVYEGSLGRILKVDIQWETSGATKPSLASWRNELDQGGGVVREFGSHIFDYMSVIDPLNFDFHVGDATYISHEIQSNISQRDIQEIDFKAKFGSVQFNCKVSRKIAEPLGHKVTLQGEKGVAQVVHKTPFELTDMSARFWTGPKLEETDCTQELNLRSITEDLEKYKLDLRQLAVRNLFVDFSRLLSGNTAPKLPNFVQGISNQLHIEEVEKELFSL